MHIPASCVLFHRHSLTGPPSECRGSPAISPRLLLVMGNGIVSVLPSPCPSSLPGAVAGTSISTATTRPAVILPVESDYTSRRLSLSLSLATGNGSKIFRGLGITPETIIDWYQRSEKLMASLRWSPRCRGSIGSGMLLVFLTVTIGRVPSALAQCSIGIWKESTKLYLKLRCSARKVFCVMP